MGKMGVWVRIKKKGGRERKTTDTQKHRNEYARENTRERKQDARVVLK